MFLIANQKFATDARKAFFTELSTRLEMMAEDLREDTPDVHFEEMAEILEELRVQARDFRVDKICAEAKAKEDPMQKFKECF